MTVKFLKNIPDEIRLLINYKYIIGTLILCVFLLAAISNPAIYKTFTIHPENNDEIVLFSGFTILPCIFLLFNYFITGILGYGLIYNLVKDIEAPLLTKILAGFLFGYVGILFPARIFSFYLTGITFYLAVVLISLGAGYYFLHKKIVPKSIKSNQPIILLQEASVFIFSIFFILVVLCLQIKQGEFHWAGHGTNQYAHYLQDWTASGMRHFPMIFQHYDEFLYHYWATIFFIPDFNPIIPWWLTLSLIKLSTLNFIFLFFRQFKVKPSIAFVFSLFIMFGTSSVLMTKYYLLFDSSNPLFFTVHSGRIVGVGVVLFLLLEFISYMRSHNSKLDLMPLIFLGVGISGTSLSNAFWVLYISSILFFIKKDIFLQKMQQMPQMDCANNCMFLNILPITVLILLAIQPFTSSFISQFSIVIRFVIYALSFCFGAKWIYDYLNLLHISKEHEVIKNRSGLIVFMFVIIGSLLILGNITTFQVYKIFPYMKNLFLYEIPPQLLSSGSMIEDASWGWSTVIGDHREIGQYLYISVFDFAAYYGIFLLSCLAAYLVLKKRMCKQKIFLTEDRILLLILLCVLLLLPLLFFFMNYVGISSRAWIKSRFIEIPIYLVLCINLYFANRLLHKREISVLVLILLIYSFVPFLATERPKQIKINAKSLMNHHINPYVDSSSQAGVNDAKGLFLLKNPGWHAIENPIYPQTLSIDYKKPEKMSSISFLPQTNNSNRAPKQIKILTSIDNQLWEESGEYQIQCDTDVPDGWRKIILNKSIETRYMKIIILNNCGDERFLTLRGLKIE